MPRFIFLIKADAMAESLDAQASMPTEIFEAMAKFNEEIAEAGVLLSAGGFFPTSKDGYRVAYSATGAPEVTSGPFDVAKENHVCGYWIVKTKDGEEALEWAKKIPFQQGELNIRRIAESEELGDGFTKELAEREKKLGEKLEANNQNV